MGSFMFADLSKATTNPRGEAGRFEGRFVVLRKSSRVEGGFEMLKSERVLEDLSGGGSRVAVLERDGDSEGDERGEDSERLHHLEKKVEKTLSI